MEGEGGAPVWHVVPVQPPLEALHVGSAQQNLPSAHSSMLSWGAHWQALVGTITMSTTASGYGWGGSLVAQVRRHGRGSCDLHDDDHVHR